MHSGIERDAFFIKQLAEAQEQGKVRSEDVEALVAALTRDQQRRLSKIRVLLAEISRLQAEGAYQGVVLGGDLNFEPDSLEYQELESAGLRDTYTMASPSDNLYSYDPQQNVIAGQGKRDVPSALRSAVAHLSESQQEQIFEAYRRGISQARRIDFLFLMHKPSDRLHGCLRQELFGQPASVAVDPGSDHFGVLVTYFADPSEC